MPEFEIGFEDGDSGTFYDADENGQLLYLEWAGPEKLTQEINRRALDLQHGACVRDSTMDEIEEKFRKFLGERMQAVIGGKEYSGKVLQVYPHSGVIYVRNDDGLWMDIEIEDFNKEEQLPN